MRRFALPIIFVSATLGGAVMGAAYLLRTPDHINARRLVLDGPRTPTQETLRLIEMPLSRPTFSDAEIAAMRGDRDAINRLLARATQSDGASLLGLADLYAGASSETRPMRRFRHQALSVIHAEAWRFPDHLFDQVRKACNRQLFDEPDCAAYMQTFEIPAVW